jgi:hypothetical protein
VDLGKLAFYNKGFKYLLTCIDVLSRYAWVVPLKDKTGKTLKEAFQVIFKTGQQPIRLQTDKGTEFTNRIFQKFLNEHDVHFFTTYNEETKANIVERFNRTLKTKMWKYFTYRETLPYVDVLSDMVASYNHTVHRTIGIPPAEVTWANQKTASKKLYGRKGPIKSCKFSPGDRVRLSKAKRMFKKGYLPNWTEELFTIVRCIETRPPVYLVKDDHGEILEGTFYAEELQKVIKTDDVYTIETILKKRKKGRVHYLVKWLGYPESFNSWIFKQDLQKHTKVSVLRMAPSDTDSVSSWVTCGKKTPCSEVVFLFQVVILYTVIIVSLYNLTVQSQNSILWTALLSSCLGYLLASPTIKT